MAQLLPFRMKKQGEFNSSCSSVFRFLWSLLLTFGLMFLLSGCGKEVGKDVVIFDTDMGYVQFSVDVVQDPEDLAQGLSGVRHLPENKGMLFIFDTIEVRHFWMNEMHIPLDIIYVGADDRVVHILKDAQPCETVERCPSFSSMEPTAYVVEVNAGLTDRYGIKKGSLMEIQHQ